MKKLLVTLALLIALFAPGVQKTHAEDLNLIPGASNFDVSEILVVPDSSSGQDSSILKSLEGQVDANGEVSSPLVAGIMRVINILTLLIGTFAFIALFYGGIMMMSGEENKIDRSKEILTQSIMGLVIAFMSYFIVTFVQSFFY
ncbi:MAG: hypothetical protein WC897_02135 [Candidatus Gracilibacteria bacterium]